MSAFVDVPQLRLPARGLWRCQLRTPGAIAVRPGDRVQPETIVAETIRPGPPLVVELGRTQAVVAAGQQVQAGEVLARQKKLVGRGEELQAPVSGTILWQSGADLLLQPPPLTFGLGAQLPGTVAAVYPGSAVELEGQFGFLTGYAGGGAGTSGRLGEEIAIVPEPLTIERLRALAGQGVRAVVAASWAEGVIPPARPPRTYLLTEPVPGRAMAPPIAEILQRHLGAPAAIQFGPEPLLGFAGQAIPQQRFGQGSWVRTAEGVAGKLQAIGASPRFFASGLRAVAAEVDLGDRTATLPLDSLEWIA